MRRPDPRKRITALALAAGWATLVATTGPMSTLQSEELSGTVVVSADNPVAAVPFDVEFTQVADDRGVAGLSFDLVFAWTGVEEPPESPPILLQSAAGVHELTADGNRWFSCYDVCRSPGELVVYWPEGLGQGSLTVSWTVSATIEYSRAEPPAGASVAFTMDAPEAPFTEVPLDLSELPESPMRRATLLVDGPADPQDRLRIAWPGWFREHYDFATRVGLQWEGGSVVLAPGLAVEVPVAELCAPRCEADLVVFWNQDVPQPSIEEFPDAELTTAFLRGSQADLELRPVPVPSTGAAPLDESLSIPAEPDEASHLLTIETDPFAGDLPPLARIAYTMSSPETLNWSPDGDLRADVGEHAFLRLGENGQVRTSNAFIPLDCDPSGCRAETPVILTGRFDRPVDVLLTFAVDVFHPDADGQDVHITLGEDR